MEQVSGPPSGECPACGERMQLTWDWMVPHRKSCWVLPTHTGDGMGTWGRCSGSAGPNGRSDPEDVWR